MTTLADFFPGYVTYDLSTHIDENAFHGILASGPRAPLPEICTVTLRFELARLFEDTFRAKAAGRLKSGERERVKSAIAQMQSYVDFVRELRHTDFPLPLPPIDFFKRLEVWLAELDTAYPPGSPVGRPPEEWITTFYPRALAIYQVVYGVEPTWEINEIDEEKSSFAVQFVRLLLDELSLTDFGHPYKENAASPDIGERKLSAISKAVRKAIGPGADDQNGAETEYLRWCRLYRSGQQHGLFRELT